MFQNKESLNHNLTCVCDDPKRRSTNEQRPESVTDRWIKSKALNLLKLSWNLHADFKTYSGASNLSPCRFLSITTPKPPTFAVPLMIVISKTPYMMTI